MKPRKNINYNMVPSSSNDSSPYAHPAFGDYNPPAKGSKARTDPLPFAPIFEPLTQSFLPEEPHIPGPPPTATARSGNPASNSHNRSSSLMSNTTPTVDITMATPPISPGPSVQNFPNRTSINSARSISVPTSPVTEKRPGRFASDFAGPFKRASWQKAPSPDISFKSHRRKFSEEASGYKTSAFTEQVLEEGDETGADMATVNTSNYTPRDTPRDIEAGSAQPVQEREIYHTASNEHPTNTLGLRYVTPDEVSRETGAPYSKVLPDDDYSSDSEPTEPTKKKKRPKADWISITILLLCIYSTIGSIFFFVVAVARPRYGRKIAATAGLKPQDAQLISAILAKTIELSFVSVFVSFLGQVLSRRALMTGSKGVNIAELSMRSWVTQPGTLLTHTSSVKFAGLTFLGALSLTATVFASFYTTAADTLVSPKLAWGSFEPKNLTAFVYRQYADPIRRTALCKTAISDQEDPPANNYGVSLARATCDGIQSAGRAYRDLSDWNEIWAEARGTAFPNPRKRPAAPSTLDLVNYGGAWLQVIGENGVNRAVMAMPHPGIISAARNTSLNGILQPDEIGDGLGSFMVRASVPNPVVDVTCASVDSDRVEWYVARPDGSRDGRPDPRIQQLFDFTDNATYVFNETITPFIQKPYAPPRFAKAPIALNTVVVSAVGDPSVYFLVRSNDTTEREGGYTMCGIQSYVTPNCSSEFQAFESGGNATANCDSNNQLAFKELLRRQGVSTIEYPIEGKVPVQDFSYSDFRNIAQDVMLSVALNNGVSNGNASVARFLSQLALDTPTSSLSNSRPSLAEALAVLLGNALITSAVDTVFTTYFPYDTSVNPGPYQEYFDAQVSTIEYTSGAGSGWKPIFYVVLIGVLLMNVFCLIYFSCVRDGFVTDWTELQNLFCVVMDGGAIKGSAGYGNGKSSTQHGDGEPWKGTGGTGPMGSQYKVGFWFTKKQGRWYVTDGGVDEKRPKSTGYERMMV